MASVAYRLHHVSPSPLREQGEPPGIHMCNSPFIDFREYRAASQDKAEKENVGSSHAPRPDVEPVRTVAPSCSTVLSEGETGARNAADQNARECNARAEARLEERKRIARELHDTLLQRFHSSLVQMQVARKILFSRAEQAGQELDRAINVVAAAIAEGRKAIQGLRCHAVDPADLGKLLTLAAQELAHAQEPKEPLARFRVIVEGRRRPLKSFVQDEVYQIGRELLRNAFRHAQASQVEAELRFQRRLLCLHVRDNGTGIDPEVLESGGRDGHWGLTGIRERTQRIGARLDFWTKRGAGTEVRLTVPGPMAYSEPSRVASERAQTE